MKKLRLKTERIILNSIIHNEEYVKLVFPFIKAEYFLGSDNYYEREIFKQIKAFKDKYGNIPTYDTLRLIYSEMPMDEEKRQEYYAVLEDLKTPLDAELKYLVDLSEKFCQEKALEKALYDSIQVIQNKSENQTKHSIPDIIKQALSVSFKVDIGHDYIEDAPKRWEYYHNKEERLPFDIDYLNKITAGGVPKKSLNIIAAGPNVGKSLMLCHLAAHYLRLGKNILYITMEMATERIAQRIDANCLDLPLSTIEELDEKNYLKLINRFRSKYPLGKLIIHEYPTVGASIVDFDRLIQELKLKLNFSPDVIIVDYLNICASSRLKANVSGDSYTYVKAISEELRSLGQRYDCPVWSAVQINRTNYKNIDMDMTAIAESFGINATADFIIAMINSEELERLGKYLIKQLKNRYYDVTQHKRFYVGVDRSRMKLTDLGENSEDDYNEDEQDRGILNEEKKSSKFDFDFS